MPKKYAHRETYDKSKPTNILSPSRYQLLEPTSENFELVSENFQNTDALSLPGNDKELRRNRNVLNSQNTGSKRPSVVINNTKKDKRIFRGLLSSLVPNYLVKLLNHQKVKETF